MPAQGRIYEFPKPKGFVRNVFKSGVILDCQFFGDHPRQIDHKEIIGQPIDFLWTFIPDAESIIDAARIANITKKPVNDHYIIGDIPRTGCCYPTKTDEVIHIGYAFPRN